MRYNVLKSECSQLQKEIFAMKKVLTFMLALLLTATCVTAFASCGGNNVKIGVQTGTTGQFYVEGDEGWGFAGYPVTCTGYKNGSMAVQDLVNGNIQYVIIDSAPAAAISASINEMN